MLRRTLYIHVLLMAGSVVPRVSGEEPSVVTSSAAFQTVCGDLQKVKFVQTDFTEEKTLHLLTHPIQSKGTLLFSPRQGVYRVLLEPVHQEMLITRAQVVQKDTQGHLQRMAVGRQPQARAFVDVFLSFFAGDSRAWEKTFATSFSGSVEEWQIEFKPRPKSPAAKGLRRITLQGHEGVLESMSIEEANGDMTRTTYSHQQLFLKSDPGEPATTFPLDLKGS